jgi:adenylate cyclase class 2
MENKDTEIEIKIQINEKEYQEIKNKLKNIANFIDKSFQKDIYFTPFHRDFTKPKTKRIHEWLRIRKTKDKNSINYKHFHPDNAEIFTHCDEIETEINSIDKIEKIFLALDFKHIITVDKEREIYQNKEFEIALDSIKELGYFIEIETLIDFGSVKTAREKLFEFAKTLGLKNLKELNIGYPQLLMKKKGIL